MVIAEHLLNFGVKFLNKVEIDTLDKESVRKLNKKHLNSFQIFLYLNFLESP